MEKTKSTLQSILYVLGASASYGILSTIVKLAYKQGFTLGEVTFIQAIIGALVLWVIAFVKKEKKEKFNISKKECFNLMLAGIPTGLTSVFYYKCVQEVPASMAILLLFQFTWLGNLIECVVEKKLPTKMQVLSMVLLLSGTALSSEAFSGGLESLTTIGIIYGLLAACMFTLNTITSSKVESHIKPERRSALMLTGATILIAIIFPPVFVTNPAILLPILKYGIPVAIFGTVIPPLFFSIGIPGIGVGLASIIASVELPVAILASIIVLHEKTSLVQWEGVGIILIGVILPIYISNVKTKKVLVGA